MGTVNRIVVLAVAALGAASVFASVGQGTQAKRIDPIIQTPGLSWSRSATISRSEFDASQGSGEVVDNVNVFNGQAYYQVPLAGINARNALSWNLSISYGSGVKPILQSSNRRNSTGVIGLGWTLTNPFVAISHMGSTSTLDDVVYCNLGPYGGGQIMQNSDGNFFVSTNPYIKVFANYEKDQKGNYKEPLQIVSWVFVMPDGNKMFFGENQNSQRTQKSVGNVIYAHPYSVQTSGNDFIYKFDISRFTTFDESTEIKFEYSQLREPLAGSASYVRESEVSKIYWQSNGIVVESMDFVYGSKYSFEYSAYGEGESKEDQRLYDTRFLDHIDSYVLGKNVRRISFVDGITPSEVEKEKYLRILRRIDDIVIGGETKQWNFLYEDNMLSQVEMPNNVVEHFKYDKLDLSGFIETRSPRSQDKLVNSLGVEVIIPKDKQDKFANSALCMEEFCFAELTESKSDDKYDFHVQPYLNHGNYFDSLSTVSLYGVKNPKIQYSSKSFVVAELGGRTIEFYEWNGSKFENKNSTLGGFFKNSENLQGTIEDVVLQNNYILVVEKDKSNENRYIHIAVKSQTTGDWTLWGLDENCGFANTADYGEEIRSKNSKKCLEWNNKIYIQSSANLVVVGVTGRNIFNVFEYDGSTFHELSSKNAYFFPDLGIQKDNGKGGIYSTNFQKKLKSVNLAGNILGLTLEKDGTEYAVVLSFDGLRFHKMLFESWKKDSKGNQFYFCGNYALLVSNSKSDVTLYRKKWNGAAGTIEFIKDDSFSFSFDGSKNMVSVSMVEDAFFLEEKLGPSYARTVVKDGAYHTLMMKVPNSPLSPVVRVPLASTVTDLSISSSDPIVLYNTSLLDGKDGALCVENSDKTCRHLTYSLHRAYSGNNFFLPVGIAESSLNFNSRWNGDKNHISSANRLILRSVLDEYTERNLIGLAQYSGINFDNPGKVPVVSEHWVDDKMNGGAAVPHTYFVYDYKSPNDDDEDENDEEGRDLGTIEYNAHTQTPQFMTPAVLVKTASGSVISKSTYHFIMDRDGETETNKLSGYLRNLQGSVSEKEDYDASGAVRSVVKYNYKVDDGSGLNWPNGLVVNQLTKTASLVYDVNGNVIKSRSSNILPDPISGQFSSSVNKSGDKFLLSQSVLQSQSITRDGINYVYRVPFKSYSYAPFSQDPETLIGTTPNTSSSLFPDDVISVSKTDYSTEWPMMPMASYSWQPALRNGKYDPENDFILTSKVVSVNSFGQVVETQRRDINGMNSSCVVYEGLRSLPTVSFSNAACSDVAATTAEHGDLNGWEMAQTVLDSEQVYDGRYSFKVVDGYGPTRNISLKELKRFEYDYVISAFAYSATANVKPMLIAEFRKSDKSILKVLGSFEPINESFTPNKWQRYELEIPYETLVADGMFSNLSEDDHLRIWIGLGEPKGDQSRIVYVDDFVAYPTSTSFTIKNYNEYGTPMSAMGMTFQKRETIFDKNHRSRGVRDSKGRIFTDGAMHEINENLGDQYE